LPRSGVLREKFKKGFVSGVGKGWHGFLWMAKILIPISLLTSVLGWLGWIGGLVFVLEPTMGLFHLPAAAALPLIIGMLTNIYGGIASMVSLPFTKEQMTLIAIFLLTAHNLIQEGVVQGKSGLHPFKATVFRLSAAVITLFCVGPFVDTGGPGPMEAAALAANEVPFLEMLKSWGATTGILIAKIFFIIMAILTLLEVMKALGWVENLVWALRPFLRVLGLSRRVGILWMTAAVFGLAYGAAVIVEEAKGGGLKKEELEGLQLSIGINHSMVEDPSLFLALGLSAFWLWVPRLVMAMVAVRLLTLWQFFRSKGRAS
jgi:hypothetical protein